MKGHQRGGSVHCYLLFLYDIADAKGHEPDDIPDWATKLAESVPFTEDHIDEQQGALAGMMASAKAKGWVTTFTPYTLHMLMVRHGMTLEAWQILATRHEPTL